MNLTSEQFQTLLPPACAWAEAQEQLALQRGIPLTPAQLEDAVKAGVAQPDRVRLLKVETMPYPDQPALQAAADTLPFLSPYAGGLSLRYAVFIRAGVWQRRLVVHELVHTAQYERLGGFMPFFQQYLTECLMLGYPNAPLEQEAIRIAHQICGD